MRPKKGRPTIKQIADRAGVSVSTASVAVNDAVGRVGAQTRKKVRRLADELGYVPNPAARQLLAGRSGRIGIALLRSAAHFPPEHGFGPEILGVWDRLQDTGFSLQLVNLSKLDSGADSFVEGMIVTGPFEEGDRPLSLPVPAVYVGVHHWDGDSLVVDADNFQAGYLAADTILQLCREICVLVPKRDFVCFRNRLSGIETAFGRRGLKLSREAVLAFPVSPRDYHPVSPQRQLAAVSPKTEGLVILDPQLLWPALTWISSTGKTIGKDIHVICIEASGPYSSSAPVMLVAMPHFEMGHEAADLLLSALSGKAKPNQRRLLPPRLVLPYAEEAPDGQAPSDTVPPARTRSRRKGVSDTAIQVSAGP